MSRSERDGPLLAREVTEQSSELDGLAAVRCSTLPIKGNDVTEQSSELDGLAAVR